MSKTFFCDKCNKDIVVEDGDSYWNYKCDVCNNMCLPKGKLPTAVIWKTSTSTVKRRGGN